VIPLSEQVRSVDWHDALAVAATRTKERIQRGESADPRLSDSPEESTAITPLLGDLLDEVAHLISGYTKLPIPALSVLIACWIANTYLYEQFRYCGYLALRSATPRCGKSRLLRIVAKVMLSAPTITTTPTAPVLFRSQRKAMVLDEVDRLRNADKENFGQVIAVLNVGFEKGAVVERAERRGQAFEVKEYPVYRPVALAGIESLADTLADRCFQIQMERTSDRMRRFSDRVLDELFIQLRHGFGQWANQNCWQVGAMYEDLPDEVTQLQDFDDRFQDIAEPLLVIAAIADAERPEGRQVLPRLLEGLKATAGRRQPSGRERELLALLDVLDPLMNGAEEGFVASSLLLEKCQEREELSYIETGRALAGLLKHFDLYPKSQSGKTRGYDVSREWISTWRSRYGH